MTNYSYLDDVSDDIISRIQFSKQEAVLLAAFPGAGKTSAAIQVCSKYLKLYPSSKIKILTHNQNLLKNQFITSIKNSFTEVAFAFGEFGSNSSVEIGIPASRKKINSQIDLLIVDEAHHYYLANMDKDVINSFNPKHILLLTGTPSVFVSLNKLTPDRFNIVSISGEELEKIGVYSKYCITNIECWSDTVSGKIDALFKKSNEEGVNLTKILVACKNIKEAKEAASVLSVKYNRKVSISTSENDINSDQIKTFLDNKTDCLVVVNKGILGFSDNYITALFDLKRSNNPESRLQLFARILRKHPNDIKKYYVSYYRDRKDMNREAISLLSCCYLMQKWEYEHFDGVVDDSFKTRVNLFGKHSDKVYRDKEEIDDIIHKYKEEEPDKISGFLTIYNEIRDKFTSKS